MTIQAKLPDGRILEFPDGTADNVIDSAVKGMLTEVSAPAPAPAPAPQTMTSETETPTSEVPLTDRVLDATPQVGGGIVGGLATASAGLGVGGVMAMAPVVGAVAFGAAAGEAYKQIGQQLSGSLDAPRTSLEAFKRIGLAGIEEGTWEAVGGLAMKGFGKILAPYKSKIVEGAQEAMDFFKDRIKPVVFLPHEATESRALDLLGNVSESSIIGGSSISKYKTARSKFFDEFADSLIDGFGTRTSPDEIGNLFVAAIERKKAVHAEASKVLYNNVGEALKEVGAEVLIPTYSLKSFARHPRKLVRELGDIEAKNAGDDLISAVMNLPGSLSFDAARELRSRLISRVDEFSVINKKAPAIGKAKKMIQLVDSAIESSLRQSAPEALTAWRTANQFYKEGQEQFNSAMIRRLVKLADDTGTGAEMIAPAIFKPGQVSRVRRVKNAIDGPEWQKLQGFFVQHLMSKSTDANGQIVGKRLLNNISGKPNSFGLPLLNEVLSPPQVETLQTFGRAVEIAQTRQSEGAGKVLIQLTQAGAMGAILTGNLELPAATVIFGPAVLSKLMLRPSVLRMLTRGLELPANAPEAAGLLSRLTSAAYRVEHPDSKEKNND